MQTRARRSNAAHARGGSSTTSCGVAVALVLGLALIGTGVQFTMRDAGAATLDGAHYLRQARYTPEQQRRRQQQQLLPQHDGLRRIRDASRETQGRGALARSTRSATCSVVSAPSCSSARRFTS